MLALPCRGFVDPTCSSPLPPPHRDPAVPGSIHSVLLLSSLLAGHSHPPFSLASSFPPCLCQLTAHHRSLHRYIPSTANSVPPPPRPLGTADRAWLGLTRLDCPPTCRLRAGDECSGLSIVHPAAPRHSSTTTSTTAAFPVCRQAGQDTYNPPTTSAPFPCRWHRTVESTTLPGPL